MVMDNVEFLMVLAELLELGTPYGTGFLSKKEIAEMVRKAANELKNLRKMNTQS